MKMTLLSMTQNILSATDSDEVNSITDTVESMQVAEIIKETFYELFNNVVVPEQVGLIQLEGLADVTRPNYLRIPSDVTDITWLRYRDNRNNDRYKEVSYLPVDKFIQNSFTRTSNGYHVQLVTDSVGSSYYIANNSAPTYYTILDDVHLVFDSYDAEYENTMHASKSIALGKLDKEFPLEDSFIPPIDSNLFPLLLAESKSVCFVNLKQIASAKEESRARRQRLRWQKSKFKSSAQNGTYKSWNFARNRW